MGQQTEIRKPSIVLDRGTRGTYAGFPATVIRHYDGNMYEIRVPGGETVIDIRYFIVGGAA